MVNLVGSRSRLLTRTGVLDVQPLRADAMQAFLLIPESEWKEALARLAHLEVGEQKRSGEIAVLPVDEILNVR